MAEDTAGQISVPTRRRAEVDWNRGAGGPQAAALPPVGPPTRALLDHLPAQAGGTILDLACGVGSPSFEAARRNPAARVLGVDRAEKLIDDARALAAAHAVTNAESSISTLVGHPGRSSGSCDDRSPGARQLCVRRQHA
jgi:2-polyprenyl-3-methyl-5-hydroxy-6-metoxy-1,4-benzoquinol methylase